MSMSAYTKDDEVVMLSSCRGALIVSSSPNRMKATNTVTCGERMPSSSWPSLKRVTPRRPMPAIVTTARYDSSFRRPSASRHRVSLVAVRVALPFERAPSVGPDHQPLIEHPAE